MFGMVFREWVVETGMWAASIAAIITAVALVNKSPLGHGARTVWSKLVGEPLSTKLGNHIGAKVSETVTPMLLTLEQDGRRLEHKNDVQHAHNLATIVAIGDRVEAVHALGVSLGRALDEHLVDADSDRRRLEAVENFVLLNGYDRRLGNLGVSDKGGISEGV
jgi:hypothetical protein